MTQTIDRTPPSLPPLLAELSRAPESAPGPVAAVLGGVLAAGLGIGALTALVMVLWIGSPYPDSGVAGALHIAAALWLLAHGAELTRMDTLSGVPAPVGVTPLLLAALPAWLAYRAGHDAACPEGQRRRARLPDTASTAGAGRKAAWGGARGAGGLSRAGRAARGARFGGAARTQGTGSAGSAGSAADAKRPGPPASAVPPVRTVWPSPWAAWCGVVLGYVLVAWGVARYADHGELRPEWTSTVVRLPLLVAFAAAAGVWRARGRMRRRRAPDRHPSGSRWAHADRAAALAGPSGLALTRRRLRASVRAGAAATLVLLAGGALLAVLPLVQHEFAARALFRRLAEDGSGRVALLLLALALIPNAAVWAASFTLGPGFVFRTGHLVAPLGTAPVPLLPGSPSLPVLPSGGYGAPGTWLAGLVPLAAGLTVAWWTAERAAPAYGERTAVWGWARTALVAAGGAVSCGAAMAVLCVYAGGPLGVGGLARFGPVWWQTGVASLVWTLAIGVPAVLVLRAWRLRR